MIESNMSEENQLILDSEQNISVDENLVRILKPHQKDGVAFMWDAVFKKHHGCILAHTMGLGKYHNLINNKGIKTEDPFLCVCYVI